LHRVLNYYLKKEDKSKEYYEINEKYNENIRAIKERRDKCFGYYDDFHIEFDDDDLPF